MGISFGKTRVTGYCGALLIGLTLGLCASAAGTPGDAPTKEVQAVWKTQELDFNYFGFTTLYPCRALEDRVKKLLIALGASKELRVRALGCMGNEVERMIHLKIDIASPVEATAEALADLEKTRSTRELAARVRRDSMTEQTGTFPATWKPVSLSRRGKLDIESGECELIEQLKKHVLPKLAVRVVSDNVSCVPNQISLNQPRLEVEALTAVPPPDEKATSSKKAPADKPLVEKK